MKNTSFPGITGFMFVLLLAFIFGCKKESDPAPPSQPDTSTPVDTLVDVDTVAVNGDTLILSQTRTPGFLNNLNNWQDYYWNSYPGALASNVAADDDTFAYSDKLSPSNSYASLSLQGFGFAIPATANIRKITLTLRRFKQGEATIGDFILTLMQQYNCDNGVCTYGVAWTEKDTYPGKTYPDTETEYVFSQSGSGDNGGYNHDQKYMWSPASVNYIRFGVRIDVATPLGPGDVTVFYDQVTLAVEYSVL